LSLNDFRKEVKLVNKADLVTAVAKKAGIPKGDAAKVVDAVFDTVQEELQRGGKVAVVGFGTFEVVRRGARKARNIRTGEQIDVPARAVPVFRPGKGLKAAVAGK
jgi:DNA-binding protein HU-beta